MKRDYIHTYFVVTILIIVSKVSAPTNTFYFHRHIKNIKMSRKAIKEV